LLISPSLREKEIKIPFRLLKKAGESAYLCLFILVWQKSEAVTEACTSRKLINAHALFVSCLKTNYGWGKNKLFSFTVVEGGVKYMH